MKVRLVVIYDSILPAEYLAMLFWLMQKPAPPGRLKAWQAALILGAIMGLIALAALYP